MSRNSSGTYTLPSGNPVVSGSVISSVWGNDTMNDIATALTDSLSRSGKGGMTAAFRSIDGVIATPGISFNSETGSGLYRAAAGDVRMAILGADVLAVTAAGLSVTGNVGIGTSSPAQTLHVKTATGGTPITLGVLSNATGLPALSFNGAYASTTMAGIYGNGASASNLYYTVPAGQNHYFAIADSAKMTLDASGNLGLGVTPSAWDGSLFRTLQIASSGGAYLTSYNGSLNMQLGYNVYYGSGSYRYVETGTAARYIQTAGNHEFYTAPSGTAGNAISFTQAMTLDASGDLTVAHLPSNTSAQSANVYVDANGKLYKGVAPSLTTPTWSYFTASGTYTVPSGVTSIRAYAGGAGGNGGTAANAVAAAGGGGGGFAYGDIAVTPGQTVTISISGGVATVTYGGTTMLTANAGTSASAGTPGSGGTSSKHASVTNGGAYSGGAGGSGNTGSGGGSCGSPLGNGYAGGTLGGGGGGIGGAGASTNGGGGGAGGAGGSVSGNSGGGGGAGGAANGNLGGPSRALNARFTDPLLVGAVSPGVSVNTGGGGTFAPLVPGPGAGSCANVGSGYGNGAFAGGDFGGGGGFYTSSGTAVYQAGNGGLMGGGGGCANGAASGSPGAIGGNGGLGGGGGGASAMTTRTAGTGGGAFVFIYG